MWISKMAKLFPEPRSGRPSSKICGGKNKPLSNKLCLNAATNIASCRIMSHQSHLTSSCNYSKLYYTLLDTKIMSSHIKIMTSHVPFSHQLRNNVNFKSYYIRVISCYVTSHHCNITMENHSGHIAHVSLDSYMYMFSHQSTCVHSTVTSTIYVRTFIYTFSLSLGQIMSQHFIYIANSKTTQMAWIRCATASSTDVDHTHNVQGVMVCVCRYTTYTHLWARRP